MNARGDRSGPAASATPPAADSYAPHLRTALVLTGTGTAGAYHAGVLRALHEAGVKIDVAAGRGIGAMGALFAAVDGAQRLWDDKGFWRAPGLRVLYRWRPMLRASVAATSASLAIIAVPIGAVALGLLVFPIDFVLKMIGIGGAAGLVDAYLRGARAAFAPEMLPTWLPRIVVLVLGATALAALAGAWRRRGSRRASGPIGWRLVHAPLSARDAADRCWTMMWDLVRGAAQLKPPPPADLARRCTEMLAENLGQPGFRELVFTVHDLDARRDLVFAMVAEPRRRDLVRRQTTAAADARRAEVFDLSGVAREYLADAVAAALTVPLATEAREVTFAPDGYWRGETHRLTDRPAALVRLLEELAALGVQQAVLVSASPESRGPHALSAPRLDLRAALGEYLQSSEAAVVHDAVHLAAAPVGRVFTIRPDHNPLGPFDFDGARDDRSDRAHALDELMSRGYEDAYRQFIEPVVGASGERISGATLGS
jgi:patatin-like phospholipase